MPRAKTSCFVDTNALAYTLDPEEPERRALSANLPERVTATSE
jgi:hypothetical protein